jgi:hypothetical protein
MAYHVAVAARVGSEASPRAAAARERQEGGGMNAVIATAHAAASGQSYPLGDLLIFGAKYFGFRR